MMRWRIRTYRSASGKDEVDEWYQGLDEKARAKVRVRLEHLRDQPREGWQRPYFDALSGPCAGLGEIRLKITNTQFRLIGFFGPEQLQFNILLVAVEKDRKFEPRNACKIGQKRRKEISKDQERCDDWF